MKQIQAENGERESQETPWGINLGFPPSRTVFVSLDNVQNKRMTQGGGKNIKRTLEEDWRSDQRMLENARDGSSLMTERGQEGETDTLEAQTENYCTSGVWSQRKEGDACNHSNIRVSRRPH